MIDPIDTNAEDILKGFQELIDRANSEIPEIAGQVEAYTLVQAEVESFRAYLEIINGRPAVVTANRAS
jgi:hypothetical protein